MVPSVPLLSCELSVSVKENPDRKKHPFVQSRKCMSLRFTEKLCFMTVKNDTKTEEELTCHFKIDMRSFTNLLIWALGSLKNFCFNWLDVTKLYIVWAAKVQRSYLSWHWRVMQFLKKNWLVVSKRTCEIWQIFTRALGSVKIGTLMGFFCPK